MAQWTVALSPEVLAASPGGGCTIRVRTSAVDGRGQPLYATFVIRDGQTIRSDDPEVARALNGMLTGTGKVVNALGARPANPTHDVDTEQREPLPDRVAAEERTR